MKRLRALNMFDFEGEGGGGGRTEKGMMGGVSSSLFLYGQVLS